MADQTSATINNGLLKRLYDIPVTYNQFFHQLSEKAENIEPPYTPQFTAEDLGDAMSSELGDLEDFKEEYDVFNKVFRAAKIGYTILKIQKTPQEWAIGGIRGGYGSNI